MLKRLIITLIIALSLGMPIHASQAPQATTQPQQKQHTCKYFVHTPCTECNCQGCLDSAPCSHTNWVCAQCNKPCTLDEKDKKILLRSMTEQERKIANNEISIHTETLQALKDDPTKTYEDARRIAKQKNIDQWKQRAAIDKANAAANIQAAQQTTFYAGMTKLVVVSTVIGVHCYYHYHGEPLPWWANLITDIARAIV